MKSSESPLSVLVVTDSYPPNVQGGAELSLSIVLSELAGQGVKVTVAKTAKSRVKGESQLSIHNGVDVYEISPAIGWPYSLPEVVKSRFPLLTRLRGLYNRLRASATHFSKIENTSIQRKLQAILLGRRLKKVRAQYWTPMMDSDYDSISSSSKEVLRLIDRLKPDVVHADNYRAILLVGKLNLTDVTTVAHVRDNRFFCPQRDQPMNIKGQICSTCDVACTGTLPNTVRSRVGQFLAADRDFRRNVLRTYSSVVTTSKFLDRQVATFLGEHSKTSIVANPSDHPKMVQSIQTGIDVASPPEILIVGMINQNKGQRNIVRWIVRLREEVADFRFVLAGRGQMENALKKEARRAGVSDYLVLPGFLSREELYRCYARATVVVAPNIWPEPFGRVPLEAALSNKPMIAYDLGGPAETIVNGETGILVPHGDEEALLSSIVTLLRNPEKREKLGLGAYERVQEKYSVGVSSSALLTAWRQSYSQYQTSLLSSTRSVDAQLSE